MSGLVLTGSITAHVPALVSQAGERAGVCFLEFFTATIRNANTRRAYARAVNSFLTWCHSVGVPDLAAVAPLHVATWIELQTQTLSAPSVKQRLAALRHLFDWLVVGQIGPHKTAHHGGLLCANWTPAPRCLV